MNERIERLEDIKIEDEIWLLYLIIIGISFISNEYEKKYFLYNDQKSKEIYRILTIIIFTIVTLVYYYFSKDSLENIKNLKPWDNKKKVQLTYKDKLKELTPYFVKGAITFGTSLTKETLLLSLQPLTSTSVIV